MKKLLKPTILLILVYVVPLLGATHMLLGIPLLLAAAAGWVLLVSQPEINKQDAVEHRSTDKLSILLLLVVGILAHLLPVIEWRLRGFVGFQGQWQAIQLLGIVLVLIGLTIRLRAIRSLGRFFTATVQVQAGQELMTKGIYSRVRHPSYLGALIAMVGHALLLAAPISALLAGALMVLAYTRRIAAEETTLHNAFGDPYSEYVNRTSRLIPGLW